ncbi:Protein CONSERVED IN THE GREEN LINEAGE AND DIATOMS 27, chloroplastic [Linum perenne]
MEKLLFLHSPPPPHLFRSISLPSNSNLLLLFPPPNHFPNFTRRRRCSQSFPSVIPSASFRNGSDVPETGCPVPVDQQPINEYQSLSTSFPFSWASGDIVQYCSRLFVTGASFALFVGLPVAWFGSVGPQYDPLKPLSAAVSSGILVVSLAVLRMYLGWAYVGNRLLSATVEYEETGWYDGQTNLIKQIWVKTPEVLTRDRLLGSITVKPVLSRLKNTLVTLAAMLVACVLLFVSLEREAMDLSIRISEAAGAAGRAVPGVYNDDSARSFEPDAFCGEPSNSPSL